MKFLKTMSFLAAIFSISGCDIEGPLVRKLDSSIFQYFGETLFSDPDHLTTKEVHFDTGRLIGKEVVLQGEVLNWGEHGTHLVLNDEFGRLLVRVTDIVGFEMTDEQKKVETLRVLGTVKRGKKGLPYLLARSIKPVGEPQSM